MRGGIGGGETKKETSRVDEMNMVGERKEEEKKGEEMIEEKEEQKEQQQEEEEREEGPERRICFQKFSCLVSSCCCFVGRSNTAYVCVTGLCFKPPCVRPVRLQKEMGEGRGEGFPGSMPHLEFLYPAQRVITSKESTVCITNDERPLLSSSPSLSLSLFLRFSHVAGEAV